MVVEMMPEPRGSGFRSSTLSWKSRTTAYTFDAAARDNIAVYFGQTNLTGTTSLSAQCANANIDIVILAFVTEFDASTQKYPTVNFGAACGGTTNAMALSAPGLLYCPLIAANITECQKRGKKVFLSLGGTTGRFSLPTSHDAETLGDNLWTLFGPPGNIDHELRPFGDVTLDGFDFNIESGNGKNFKCLGARLREKFGSDPSRQYYLSAAPQCPFPDRSTPMDLVNLADFVWVQFYNNPPCQIGSDGFHSSLRQWSSELPVGSRLYLGAPGYEAASPDTYNTAISSPSNMQGIMRDVISLNLPNIGGLMFWDGPESLANSEGGGKSIVDYGKAGMRA
ncbi:hypothetical protein PG994_015386 [Apiospora phragmitis]|uniref:chitinase n=1 Tax=Apiospora phragmitis TaxID=2905665 RepID=A0ABR1ST42_9PEZI